MNNLKVIRSILKNWLVVLFALCAFGDVSLAFYNTYNHNITITKQPSVGETLNQMSQQYHERNLQQQQQFHQALLHQRQMQHEEHLERLKNDPDYAYKFRLQEKANALGKTMQDIDNKLDILHEKQKILQEEFGFLYDKYNALIKKAKPTILRLDVLSDRIKSLVDSPNLLQQEKDELKQFVPRKVELDSKKWAFSEKIQAFNDKVKSLVEQFAKVEMDFANINQKHFIEATKYEHKIEYDNKAFEAFFTQHEKRADVLQNWAREKEIFCLKMEQIYEELENLIKEQKVFHKQIMKHKSFARKYERLIKKIEKRLAKLGV